MSRRFRLANSWDLESLEARLQPAAIVAPPVTNLPPTANDDFTDTDGTNPVVIDVLANDAAVGTRTLNKTSVATVTPPLHGNLAFDRTTGAVTYQAVGFFQGTDLFRYTVRDSAGAISNIATVTVVVNRPIANDDFAETTAGTPVVVDVLENDTDPDGNAEIVISSVTVVSPPAYGSVTIDAGTGEATYLPAGGFTGTDTFSYTITDKAGATSAPGHVTIVVNNSTALANPIARDDAADTDGTNPVVLDLLANDTPGTAATLIAGSVVITSGPGRGIVTVDKTGAATYTATGFFIGTDSFKYTVQDSNGKTSNEATATVVVNRPTANDDFADTDGNNPVTINVLENDTDPDGNAEIDPASVTIFTQPQHGSVTVDAASGEVTYTAIGFFTGTDTFQYTITDKAGATSAPGTVTVVVNRPQANDDAAATSGLTPIAVDVLFNDTDPDGVAELNPDSVAVKSLPAHGTLAIEAKTGLITYTPNTAFIGTDSFTYTVTDFPGAESNLATVRVRVDSPKATQITASGADASGGPRVLVTDADGNDKGSFFAYDPAFHGGVRVAIGDLTGDGVPDIVTAPGAGGGPQIRIFDGATLKPLSSFFAFDSAFRGGVSIAVADTNGDGRADIVTGAGPGGGPHVRVFDGGTGLPIFGDFVYDAAFRGGVNVAAGDVNGDGRADIITTPASKGASHVKVISGANGQVLRSSFAFDPAIVGGFAVTAADFDGDGHADAAMAIGAGNAPEEIRILSGRDGSNIRSFLPFNGAYTGGIRLAAADLTGDGRSELLVGTGTRGEITIYNGADFNVLRTATPFGTFLGGVFVGGAG